MPLNPPAFSPPKWPRLGRRPTAQVVPIAPAPVEIPLCWLTGPVRLRLEQPYTTASVSRPGATSNDVNVAARTAYGDLPFTATLDTATAADSGNLAHWTITYRAEPLVRSPEIILDLMHRTEDERLKILELQRFQRIKLIGVPPEFPEGASDLVISGVTHEVGVHDRRVRFTTRPLVGTAPGVSGPWFRLGYSSLGGPDHLLF